MIDVELWYFLYCGSGHVDLEGALDRFYFISLLEEGELSRSTQVARLTWLVSSSQPACVLLHSAICLLCALYDLALLDHEILEMEAFFFLLSVTYASGSTYGNFPLCAYVL